MAVYDRDMRLRPWLRHYPDRIPPNLEYPKVPLYQFLRDSAEVRSGQTALVFFGKRTSYAALLDEVKRVAGGLVRLGLKKGDRVAVILPNCPQVVATYYGVLWAGGVVVMLNPLYTPREIQVQLQDAGARFIVALDLVYPRVAQEFGDTDLEKIVVTSIQERLPFPLSLLYRLRLRLRRQAPTIPKDDRTMRYARLVSGDRLDQPVPVEPESDLAVLQYTAGTTGVPKGAMLTHFNLVSDCIQIGSWYPHSRHAQVSILGALPFFHAYGMTTAMNYGIMVGARIVLLPRFEVQRVLETIQKHKPQLFPGVPAMYVALNHHPNVERFDLSSIEWCISGAAPLPPEVKETFERLTGGQILEGYGLSEASPVTHCNPPDGVNKTGSIGLPFPDVDCRIIDMETGEPVSQGEVGELLIRGPQVMKGYWNRPEESSAMLGDGWLHTGDIARMDEQGYFTIVDRKKEMILVSGFNVYPREVEDVLYMHPAVKEAAVIGVPDSQRGESVKAFVVLKEELLCSGDDLIAWSRERLAVYKVPRQVEFVMDLPKSLIGKVLRRVLVEQDRDQRADAALES